MISRYGDNLIYYPFSKAGEVLSSVAAKAAKLGTNLHEFNLANDANDDTNANVIGVFFEDDAATIGDPIKVLLVGICEVLLAGTVSKGDRLTSDASTGGFIARSANPSSSGSPYQCVATALEAGVSGAQILAFVCPENLLAATGLTDLALPIYNDTGGTLAAGTLVRVKGYTSTSGITVEKADADAAKPATHVVKVAISNSASGVVYPTARVTGMVTNGQTIGDAVYLSATAGEFVFTAPTGADQLSQQVGTVKVVHASTGEIEFFPGAAEYLKFGTTFIQNDAITTDQLQENTIQYASVTITNAQLLAIRATPKELVAAPGAGKSLEFVSAVLFFDYTAAYTETTDNLAVKYENGSGVAASQTIEATGFVDATADTMTNCLASINTIVAKTGCENKALVLHNTGDGEYGGGDSANVVRVKVAYRVHTTGW